MKRADKCLLISALCIGGLCYLYFFKVWVIQLAGKGEFSDAEEYYCDNSIDSVLYFFMTEYPYIPTTDRLLYLTRTKNPPVMIKGDKNGSLTWFKYLCGVNDTTKAVIKFCIFSRSKNETKIILDEYYLINAKGNAFAEIPMNSPRYPYATHKKIMSTFENQVLNPMGFDWHRNWIKHTVFYRFPFEEPIYRFIYKSYPIDI